MTIQPEITDKSIDYAGEMGPKLIRPLPSTWWRFDIFLAAFLVIAGFVLAYVSHLSGIFNNVFGPAVWVYTAVVLICGPLAFYRRYPIAVAMFIALVSLVFLLTVGVEVYTYQVAMYLSFYGVGAWENNRRRALWARIVILVINFSAMTYGFGLMFQRALAADGEQTTTQIIASWILQILLNIAFYGLAWYFGNSSWKLGISSHALRNAHGKLQAAHEALASTQDQLASVAVQQERMHIARELHDVTAHHVTVMGVHASAARRILGDTQNSHEPVELRIDRATQQIRAVEAASQEAIAELRNLVYTLRDQESHTDKLPDLTQLPQLVEAYAHSTRSLSLRTDGTPVQLSAAVELTLYRVVQESLSNASKHAGPWASINVVLRYTPQEVSVEITDNGYSLAGITRPDQPRLRPGTGTGVQGMHERMQAVGGTLRAGSLPYDSGWQVLARVPLKSVATTARPQAIPAPEKHEKTTENTELVLRGNQDD